MVNVAKCNYADDALQLENLSLVEADVRSYSMRSYLNGQTFDATFCSGLLDHLDEPTEFLRAPSDSCRRILILQTHFVAEDLPIDEALAAKLSPSKATKETSAVAVSSFPRPALSP